MRRCTCCRGLALTLLLAVSLQTTPIYAYEPVFQTLAIEPPYPLAATAADSILRPIWAGQAKSNRPTRKKGVTREIEQRCGCGSRLGEIWHCPESRSC